MVKPLWITVEVLEKNLKVELPYDPAVPLLGIYPEKTLTQKDTCTPMFIAAVFKIAQTWMTASDPVMWLRGFSMKKSQFWVLCSSPKDCKSHVKPNPQRGRKSRRLMPRRQVISVKYG